MDTLEHKWEFPAICIRVIDGDTFEAELDLGFKVKYQPHIRLSSFSAPELSERGGKAAKDRLEKALRDHEFKVQTEFVQSFARWVGEVIIWKDENWISVSEVLKT